MKIQKLSLKIQKLKQTKHRCKISVNDPRDEFNESLLFHAAFRDRRRCARSLLYKHAAEVDILKSPTMVTPIFAAVAKNNLEILEMLLDKNANISLEAKDGSIFPLFLATIMGHDECVLKLLEAGAPMDQRRKQDGTTAVFAASAEGHLKCLQHLLRSGADITIPSTVTGLLPQHIASHLDNPECLKYLIEKRCDLNYVEPEEGYSPLMIASRAMNTECMDILVRAGANLECKTKQEGNTALHICAGKDDVEAVKILLAGGSNVHAKAETGETPLDIASLELQADNVRILLAKGAVPSNGVLRKTILGFLGERALFHRVTGGMFGTPPLSQNEQSVLRLMLRSDKSGISDVKELLDEADLTFDYIEEDKEENEEALKKILVSSKKKTRWFNENDQKCLRTLLMISNRLGHFRDVIVEYLLPLVIHRKLWGIGWFDARLSKKKRKRSDSEVKEERERARQRQRRQSEDNDDNSDDDFGMRSGVITMREDDGTVHTEVQCQVS